MIIEAEQLLGAQYTLLQVQEGGDSRRRQGSELVNHVELIALENIFGRCHFAEVQGPAQESGERQLHIVEGLVENLNPVLADVASLPDVAGVKN